MSEVGFISAFSLTYELIPTCINNNLGTELASDKKKEKLLKSWKVVSEKLAFNGVGYTSFYNKEYRQDFFLHILSTLSYQIKNKSLIDLIKVLISRAKDFKNMGRWLMKDTSKMRNNLDDKTML